MEQLEKGVYAGVVSKTTWQQDPSFAACITSYTQDRFNGSLHCHQNAHFSFVLEGGCVETKKDDYELLPGSFTYYPAGEVHQVLRVAKPLRRVNVELDAGFFHTYGLSCARVHERLAGHPDAKFFLVKVYQELLRDDPLSVETIKMLLLQLICAPTKLRGRPVAPCWLKCLKEYLHENPTGALTLNDLAAVAGVHPVTISKNFPLYFHSTLGEYMRKLKVEKALNLLKSSSCSLTEISLDVGFYDQSHFIRNFKRLTGYLPSAYQKL